VVDIGRSLLKSMKMMVDPARKMLAKMKIIVKKESAGMLAKEMEKWTDAFNTFDNTLAATEMIMNDVEALRTICAHYNWQASPRGGGILNIHDVVHRLDHSL
jgi:hypothetical protein